MGNSRISRAPIFTMNNPPFQVFSTLLWGVKNLRASPSGFLLPRAKCKKPEMGGYLLSKYSHGAWDRDAISMFREFCGSDTFSLVVVSKSSSFGTGDLTVVDVVKNHNGVPVNLRQFLSYRDVLVNSDIQQLDSFKIKETITSQHLDPIFDEFTVRIVHVNDPSEFYIILDSSNLMEHEVSKCMKEIMEGEKNFKDNNFNF